MLMARLKSIGYNAKCTNKLTSYSLRSDKRSIALNCALRRALSFSDHQLQTQANKGEQAFKEICVSQSEFSVG